MLIIGTNCEKRTLSDKWKFTLEEEEKCEYFFPGRIIIVYLFSARALSIVPRLPPASKKVAFGVLFVSAVLLLIYLITNRQGVFEPLFSRNMQSKAESLD